MIGNPKYAVGDIVKFDITLENDKIVELTGEIYIVDKFGTFFDNSDVCYDIMANFGGDKVFIKHINEKGIK